MDEVVTLQLEQRVAELESKLTNHRHTGSDFTQQLLVNGMKCGTTTQGGSSSGANTIAHGLGRTPKWVRITCYHWNGGASQYWCQTVGVYNGTTTASLYALQGESSTCLFGNSSTNIAEVYGYAASPGDTDNKATISVDGQNITLTWTANSLGGTINIMWEAF